LINLLDIENVFENNAKKFDIFINCPPPLGKNKKTHKTGQKNKYYLFWFITLSIPGTLNAWQLAIYLSSLYLSIFRLAGHR
jgi:hypothetical protein